MIDHFAQRARRCGAGHVVVLGVCVGLLFGCGRTTDRASSGAVPSGDVAARFGALEVTTAEVDARILALPASERPVPGADLDAWYRDLLVEMVVDARLRVEADAARVVDDPAFRQARGEAERQAELQLCLAALRPDLGDVTDAELRAAYDARADRHAVPERRFVYHLFLRRDSEQPADASRLEIESLRERALRGEHFGHLAEDHSDSESRHRQGLVGWVTPGVLPAGFEAVVFDLQEGVPSQPLTTRDGHHLFLVDQIMPARTMGFDEVRQRLRQGLVAERQAALVEALEAEITLPEDALVLDRDAFRTIVADDDPEALVSRIGTTEIRLGDLRQRLGQQARRQSSPRASGIVPLAVAWQTLDQWRRRELILYHCRETEQIDAASLAASMERWQEPFVLRFQRQRRLIELAKRDDARLRLFYDSNLGEFSSPPTWHVRLAKMPLGTAPVSTMARLEAAVGPRETTLDTLTAELGGTIEDLGFVDLAALGWIAPRLPALVTPREVGEWTAPIRLDQTLVIAEVVARRDAVPMAYDEVVARVAAAYVDQYRHEVYRELSDEILLQGEHRLEVIPEVLATLREAGLPQPEISVDELESLLDEI